MKFGVCNITACLTRIIYYLVLLVSGVIYFPVYSTAALIDTNSTSSIKNAIISRATKTGFIRLLKAKDSLPTPIGTSVEMRSRSFLQMHQKEILNTTFPLELTLIQSREPGPNTSGFSQFQQTIEGINVTGATITVRFNNDGITSVTSKLHSQIDFGNLIPNIDAHHARQIVSDIVAEKMQLNTHEIQFGTVRLELYSEDLIRGQPDGVTRLSWFVQVAGQDFHDVIWIDAQNGKLIKHVSQIANALSRIVRDYANTDVTSTLVREESDDPTNDLEVDSAFKYTGYAFNYFFDNFARDDFNGVGDVITIGVRHCSGVDSVPTLPCPNPGSRWDGSTKSMFFSLGYSQADDIVAHEFSHGIIENSINFFLTGQSGALAESLADIFGEIIDLSNGDGNDDPSVRWLIGEDIVGAGALRNMKDPHTKSHPAKVLDNAYYCGQDDAIYIHSNNGVPNHAFSLLVDGGNYNGFTINGIGIQKAQRIYYELIDAAYLTPTSQFADLFEQLPLACGALIGSGDISANDCKEVEKSLAAVEMNILPCSKRIPLCPIKQQPEFVFNDDLENINSGNWTTTVIEGVNHWNLGAGTAPEDVYYKKPANGQPWRNYPRSGQYSFWSDSTKSRLVNGTGFGDSAVEMKSNITLPDNARFQFSHNFIFDYRHDSDGGVVEISIDNGSWVDIQNYFVLGQDYNGIIDLAFQGIPNLRDRNGFTWNIPKVAQVPSVGENTSLYDYVNSQYEFSTLAGSQAKVRFRTGTDNSGTSEKRGWIIDDISIYGCAPAFLMVTPQVGLQTSENGGTASFNVSLAFKPDTSVTLTLLSDNPNEGVVTHPQSKTLSFSLLDWDQPQEVVVGGQADDFVDGNVQYHINISDKNTLSPAFETYQVTIVNIDKQKNKKSGILGCNLNNSPWPDPGFVLLLAFIFIARSRIRT